MKIEGDIRQWFCCRKLADRVLSSIFAAEKRHIFLYLPISSQHAKLVLFIISDEFGGTCGKEVTEVGCVDNASMGTEGVLRTVEEEVAETGVGIAGEAVDEILREAVTHPDLSMVVPAVGP